MPRLNHLSDKTETCHERRDSPRDRSSLLGTIFCGGLITRVQDELLPQKNRLILETLNVEETLREDSAAANPTFSYKCSFLWGNVGIYVKTGFEKVFYASEVYIRIILIIMTCGLLVCFSLCISFWVCFFLLDRFTSSSSYVALLLLLLLSQIYFFIVSGSNALTVL